MYENKELFVKYKFDSLLKTKTQFYIYIKILHRTASEINAFIGRKYLKSKRG